MHNSAAMFYATRGSEFIKENDMYPPEIQLVQARSLFKGYTLLIMTILFAMDALAFVAFTKHPDEVTFLIMVVGLVGLFATFKAVQESRIQEQGGK